MNSKIQLTFNYSQKSLKISYQYYIVLNKEFRINAVALIETGTNLNCRREGLISTKYFAKNKRTKMLFKIKHTIQTFKRSHL